MPRWSTRRARTRPKGPRRPWARAARAWRTRSARSARPDPASTAMSDATDRGVPAAHRRLAVLRRELGLERAVLFPGALDLVHVRPDPRAEARGEHRAQTR